MVAFEYVLTLLIVLFGWFISILTINTHYFWIGPVFISAYVIFYLISTKFSSALIKFMLCACLIGYTSDALLKLFHIISFSAGTVTLGLQIPLSFIFIWLLFATAFPPLFRPLGKRYWLAATLGFIVGAIMYYLAFIIKAVILNNNLFMALISIGITWSLMMTIFLRLMNNLIQWHPQSTIKTNHRSI